MADIWTDGACAKNPGRGGWAYVLEMHGQVLEGYGSAQMTTNNRMELTAAIKALMALPPDLPARVHSDSRYVVDGATKWLQAWKRRAWRTRTGEPVKNDDLWRLIDELMTARRVEWVWVRGHVGHRQNERCDVLATRQAGTDRGNQYGR